MVSRRRFLTSGAAVIGALAASPALGAVHEHHERSVFLYNVHTGETLKTIYWVQGHYQPSALQKLNHLLRDHYSNQVHRMDPRLIDLLFQLQHRVGTTKPFEVFSGYRSPATNAMLAQMSEGVAAHSLHMQGMAADICLPGTGIGRLGRAARAMKAGGVGSYSDFIHVDVGRVRYW